MRDRMPGNFVNKMPSQSDRGSYLTSLLLKRRELLNSALQVGLQLVC